MLNRPENVIVKKTEAFADRIVKMCRYLSDGKCDNMEMVKQIVRCGTSIGANTAESQYAQSRADFLSKLTIALKEANETKFWLTSIYSAKHLTEKEYNTILKDNV